MNFFVENANHLNPSSGNPVSCLSREKEKQLEKERKGQEGEQTGESEKDGSKRRQARQMTSVLVDLESPVLVSSNPFP
jgi:hypothetical protein